MSEERIFPLLVRFSFPAVAGMLVQALYNVVDRIYIGRGVGSVGIAATTVSMPMMIIGFGFALMIGIGGGAQVSIRLGEKRTDKAEQVLGNALGMLLIASVGMTGLGLAFLTSCLKLFGATETILPYARDYMGIIVAGWIFQTVGFGLNNFIRAEGNLKTAMGTMLIGSVANMILDPVFIFVLGWGMKGAATATVISQSLSALWVLHYYLGGSSLLKIRSRCLRFQRAVVLRILAIGGPPFLMHMSECLMVALVNAQLRIHGADLGISMFGVIISLMTMIFMFVMGVSQGAQPIIGYNYGALRYDRVKRTVGLAVAIVTVVVSVAFVVIMLLPATLVRMFSRDDLALIELGGRALPIFFCLLPLTGFQMIVSNFFQAVGKPKQAMFLVLSRTVLLQVPGILLLPRFFGLDGVWLTTPVSIMGSSLLTAVVMYVTLKHMKTPKESGSESSSEAEPAWPQGSKHTNPGFQS